MEGEQVQEELTEEKEIKPLKKSRKRIHYMTTEVDGVEVERIRIDGYSYMRFRAAMTNVWRLKGIDDKE